MYSLFIMPTNPTVYAHNSANGREPALSGIASALTGNEPTLGGERASLSDMLATLREGQSPEARREAARVLGRIADAHAQNDLLDALQSPDGGLRRMAAWALGRIAERDWRVAQRAVPGLVKSLKKPGGRQREVCAWALGRSASAAAVPALNVALTDRNPVVRRAAAEALGRTAARLEHASLRVSIVESLEQILADRERTVRKAGCEALGRIGDAEAIPSLFDALTHPDRDTRWAAAWALGQCGQPARAPLIVALGDPDPAMRQAASWGLRWLDSTNSSRQPLDP